ncbi:hypothetical protein L210DRAFT_3548440 [Boletus edulis BED1]|uniref:Uncharacterized protein n=1 Tax=Boletus edulis BED1 TaxID=1328754 RepID=A0AAD4BP95_BOLED|nr:hypothetical protein L210DRAFT_3548440 [Boletus edulis BED1]
MTLHHGATVARKMSSDHSWMPIFLNSRTLVTYFWFPTGTFAFLPIHAAGLYDTQHSQPGHEVSDFVTSPYVPTLWILAQPLNPSGVDSGLCLADGRCLKLRDIVALSRPHGGLAFLSVCHVTRRRSTLRQDCCSLDVAMGRCGRSALSDGPGLAPDGARDVYEQLFPNTRPDYQDAARTLHGADSGASFATCLAST